MISERPEPAAPPGLPAEVPETPGSPDPECPETGGLDRERLAREPGERRRELLDPWLRQVAAAALGVGAARLDAGQPLSAYGLDSLAAVEVQSRLQTVLGVEVAIVDLLAGASLDDLAAAALAKIGAPAEGTPDGGSEGGPQVSPEVGAPALAPAPPPAAEGPATGRFPLAPNQQALWFIHRLAPQGLAYHLAGAARVESPIDRAALGRALAALVARHPALRTGFAEDGEGPWQEVCERGACELLELAAAAPGEEEAVLIARLRAAAWRPFDLERGPLLRVGFLPDARPGAMSAGLLFLAVHHIVADFWSLQVMVRDLGALYARESRELPESRESWPPRAAAALPPLGLRYTDFARWQRQRLAGGEGERLWHHWRQALGGEPPPRLALPVDRPWPKVQTWPGAAHELVLPEALTVGLEGVGRARGATLFMVLLAGFQALLARTTGTPTVTVGAPTHGRSGRGGTALADLVGYFVNLVPLVAAVDGEATFAGLLAAVRAAALAAYEHQEMPLAVLAERLLPERDPARSPLFDVVFAFEKGRETRLDLGGFALGMPGSRLRLGDILLSSVAFPPAGAPFALSLVAAELGRGLGASFRFNTDLFDRATVVRLAERFRRLLAVAVAAPERRLAELPLLAPAERHQLLAAWNDTAHDYPRDAGLAELFAAAVVRAPEAVALVMDQGPAAPREAGRAGPLLEPGLQAAVDAAGAGPVVITYGELDRAANRLANHLAALGVRAEDRVAVCLPRSPRLIVALLACVKAGAAYVPLDPAYPAERLAWLLADSGAAAVVTAGEAAAALPAGGWSKVDLDDLEGDAGLIARSKAVPFVGSVGGTRGGGAADRLFCLLYTSGSTGTPKAVALVHRGVARLALGGGHARLGPDRVLAHLAPITFDAATFEIWCALANGARLVILPPGVPSLDGLGAALARHRVTTLFLTTALFHEMVEQNLAGLAPVEELFTGGDVVSLAHLERAAAALPDTRLFDAYGPTEDTTYATCWPVVPGAAAGSPPIGRPVAATEAYVLDRAGGLVPQGSAGELALAGDGLARGYWNRPELTAERFRPHPFSCRGGERVYLTGDSVRHRPDGNLQFLGRVDRQVKVRGFRVEPGEIEAALATHPGVAQSIVVVREDRPGDRRLVAYAVPRAGESAPGAPDAAQLRRHLAARLPAYLLPSSLVLLAALPVTAHGKVDRRALPAPAPDAAGTDPDSGGGAPHTPLEVILAGIWEEVLGVERVGLHDNFFALGGHSLLAARLMSRARHAFGVELPLAALFEEPTLAGFAARLAGALGGGEAAPAAFPPTLPASGTLQILPQARPEHPSLSFAQERLWFLDQLEPGSVTYSIPAALRLHGELAWAPLAGALTGIVARHEVLRTRFPEVEGQPVQRVEPPLPVPLPVVDLARLGAAAAAKESARLAAAEAAAPFALAAGPLLRARLLALGAGEWLLLLSFHHIVFDGASVEVFWRDLGTLYAAIRSRDGREPQVPLAMRSAQPALPLQPSLPPLPALPPLPIQYLDYALWQRRRLSGPALAPLVDFWRQVLAGAPPALALPTDRPRPAVRGSRGGRRLLPPAPGLAAAVAALARRRDSTSFMVLLAAWAALLGRAGGARGPGALAGHPVVVVGAPFANRDRLELEPLIGFFVNTLPVPIALAGDPAFGELLGRVRQAALAAYAHQELPFEKLVEKLSPERDPSSTPLFQAVLAFRDREAGSPGLPGVRAELLPLVLPRAKFDLMLELASGPQGLGGDLEYSVELFDAATAERLLCQFTRLLAAVAAAPELRLSEVPLLAPAERHQLLAAWNDTAREYPRDASLAALFAAAAARAPEAVALVCGERQLSYGELGRRADALAERLGSLGVGPEVVVGVCLERSPELVVALLGVLKAGGAYLPLEPAWPAERLALLLAGAGAPVLVTDGTGGAAGLAAVAGTGAPVVVGVAEQPGQGAPEARSIPGQGPGEMPAAVAAPPTPAAPAVRPAWRGDGDSLAYVIFTSGSTGEPKGVAVVQRGVARLVLGTEYARFGPEQVWLQLAPTAFDVSTLEVWGPLLNGGRLVIYPPRPVSPEELGELLAAQQVGSLWLTAGLFHQMAEANLAGLAPLEQLLAGGDVLSPAAVTRTLAALPGCRLINGYGPTEVTTFTCCQTLGVAGMPATVPIGRPIANTRAYLLDAALQPVPVGVVGELYAGGDGLARGYHRRPELTAERFVPDPCGGEPGGRLYRTGDLARHLADGRMEFLGRIDAQLKVRGVRVEPAEVEAALARHPALAAAVVVVLAPAADDGAGAGRRPEAGERRLVAYVVAAGEGPAPAAEELRAFLRRRLPEPMLPSAFVALPALPLTANGKLDRRALPAPSWGRDERQAITLPRTPAEELLAAIWCEVLGVERVGIQDRFFDLGGHSLLATRLMSRVRRDFGVELPLAALFEAPTVAGLAVRLAAATNRAAGGTGGSGVPEPLPPPLAPAPRPLAALPPLSFAQERLWFLDRLDPGSPLYNMPVAARLAGELAVAPLAASLGEVVRRHQALRTRFMLSPAGLPVQVVDPWRPAPLPLVDLSALPGSRRDGVASRLLERLAIRPFDLATGPLLRAALLRLAAREHLLLLAMHHIAGDGWSMGVLLRELAQLYPAAIAGRPSPLAELPIQYVDFALWQRAWLSGERLAAAVAAWRAALDGAATALALPVDRPWPAVQSGRGARRQVALAPALAAAAAALARRRGVTPFMLLLAAWSTLLARLCGQEDILVGTAVANRTRLEVEPLIGFFVNTLALRVDLAGEPDLDTLLARVRRTALAAYQRQDLPFERLVEELAPARDLARSPLVQSLFVLQNAPLELRLPGLELAVVEVETRTAKLDLGLTLFERDGGLGGDLEYATDLFDAATAARLGGAFAHLLAALVAAPAAPVLEVALLAAGERQQLLVEWNPLLAMPAPAVDAEPAAASGSELLHAACERQAARTPEAVAVELGAEHLSYAELEAQANRLARRLLRLGAAPETLVALALPPSPAMVAALLGILKTGAAFVPIDPGLPEARRAFLLRDSGVRLLVVEELPAVPPWEPPVVAVGRNLARLAGESAMPVRVPGSTAASLAYVLYTSGSTGEPKGVAVEHGAGAAHMAAIRRLLGLGSADRVLQFAALAFDAALEQVFPALGCGAALVMRGGEPWAPAGVFARLAALAVTVGELPTAFWQQAVGESAAATAELAPPGQAAARRQLGGLRLVSAGGEAMALVVARSWATTPAAGVRLLNSYGPTEAVISACWQEVTPPVLAVPGAGGAVPIGKPDAGRSAQVLDRRQGLAPIGVTGELFLGGLLARGYLGRPALTAERFVPDPFAPEAGARRYRTGDLVRWRPDGALEFMGRTDHQIKIRGHRVELGEVAAALAGHPLVREAVVAAHLAGGDHYLVAYVVPLPVAAAGGAAGATELRDFLRRRLPSAMVPADYVFLAAMPLNSQGKVDRRALPAPPARTACGHAGLATAPRGPVEELLAGIWEELLGLEQVAANDNFFDLGGHSLLATRVASRLRATLGLELPLRRVFELPTVAGLAGEIERLQREGGKAAAGGPPAPVLARRDGGAEGTPAVLSFSQERLWFLDRFEPGSLLNMPAAVRLSGELDVRALGAALAEIVRRHQVLRTGFVELADGRPAQVVQPWRPQCLRLVELSALAAPARQAEAQRLARAEAAAPFDLRRGPMLRATLLRLGPLEHGVLLTLHHIAADGWSVSLLRRELGALYTAFAGSAGSAGSAGGARGAGGAAGVAGADAGSAAGRASPLPELELQYADFARWQREWLTGAVLAEQSAYWRQALAGPPAPLELPTDRLRPAVQTFTGGERWLRLPAALSSEVKALGRRRGATLFMTLLAAVEVVFGRWSGQDEVVVGTPIAGRNRAETEPLIGLFLNHLVLRTDLSGDPSFGVLLGRLRETTLGAFAHQDLPFEKLLEEIKPERDLSRTPLFQVLFNLINVPMEPLRLPGLTESPLAAVGADSKFDMTFYVEETGGEVAFHLVYNADLFDGGRMVELLSQIEGVLAQAVADPELPLGSLSLLTAAAAAVLPHPERVLGATWQGAFHEQFAAHARRLPGKLAVSAAAGSESGAGGVDGENGAVSESGAGGWTYAELDAESNRLAHWLLAGGIAKGDVVAIHAHRGAPLVVAVIGVLKAGGVFLLLDPAYPPRRQAELLGLAGARAFVHLAATGELPEPLAAAVAALPRRLTLGEAGGDDRPSAGGVGANGVSSASGGIGGNGAGAAGGRDGRLPQLAGWPATAPGVAVGPDDACVLTFTSGSTGVPKGVLGRHGSLAHFAPWAARRFGLSSADRSAMTSGLAHDPMQRDICVPLQLGATLCIPDPVALWSSGWLAGWLRRAAITFVNLTPAMVQLLTERGPGAAGDPPVPSLRHAFLVGDVLTRRQVERLVELAPAVTCVNLYGSTEGQRAVSYHVTSPAPADGRPGGGAGLEEREMLPLGRGIDEVELLVLDRQRRVAGIGELGELAIRSHHLALGYLGDPAQTAQRFVVNPGTGLAADRIYLTGDLGRYLPDGEAEFVARADNQVKIRGFRIEPAEIEMALTRHPGLREAAVIARADRGGDKRLVAYVVAAAAGTEAPAPSVLQDFLRLALPEYMVPGAWVTLPALPLTANGKLDRRALPEPASAAAGDEAGYVAPSTAAELAVAEVWQDVLGVERVGVHDKFFHLGGHSLLLVRVQGRLAERFGKPLSILDLFKYPDLASLARFLAAEPAAPGVPETAAAEEPDAAREQQLELGKTRRRQRLALRGDPDPADP